MPEWWTYSLSDFLMFSPRTYYRLFELHNAAIWPAQWRSSPGAWLVAHEYKPWTLSPREPAIPVAVRS